MANSFVYRIFSTAVIAGGVAGLFLAVIQHFTVVPMILEAETYEIRADGSGQTHGHDQQSGDADGGHTHDGEAWAPDDGFERGFFTFANTMIIGIGFALLLVACYAIRKMVTESRVTQSRVNWRWGILWGLGGFAAFHLAPAVGMPPELPGAAAVADLGARQVWWWLTVVLTGCGLLALALAPGSARWLGLALVAIPHLLGAPQTGHAGLAPPELASAFVVTSLATHAIFWAVLGALTALLYERRS